MRNFYIASVGKQGEDYVEGNFDRCIADSAHYMHINTKQKGQVYEVKPGDIVFLKYNRQLVAYGEAIQVDDKKRKCPQGWDGWYLEIKVKQWFFHDVHDPRKGISNYGIQENQEQGASQMGTVKRINPEWAINKIKELNTSTDLYVEVSKEKTMVELSILITMNKNVVLTGAPGTGKTYRAFELAKSLTGATEDNDPRIGLVQFHPSYDYSDFVEGIKPELVAGSVILAVHDGIFKSFCKTAAANPKHKYVFIIDEINRADLSRVFGELFFGLETGYRGKPIKTQYAYLQEKKASERGESFVPFTIPDNVHIIGTMNDIDRSVESMDFALRRRFVWKEITAKDSEVILDAAEIDQSIIDKAKMHMANLNAAIEKEMGSTAYQIGGAYFKKLELYANEDDCFAALWKNHLEVVLSEYVRGMPKAHEMLKHMETAYKTDN